jgi:hypothetical protein
MGLVWEWGVSLVFSGVSDAHHVDFGIVRVVDEPE